MVNHEQQYSFWPAEKPIPLGWKNAEKEVPKANSLVYIKGVWTDLIPLSLKNMAGKGSKE